MAGSKSQEIMVNEASLIWRRSGRGLTGWSWGLNVRQARPRGVRFLGRGLYPSPPAKGVGSAISSPSGSGQNRPTGVLQQFQVKKTVLVIPFHEFEFSQILRIVDGSNQNILVIAGLVTILLAKLLVQCLLGLFLHPLGNKWIIQIQLEI